MKKHLLFRAIACLACLVIGFFGPVQSQKLDSATLNRNLRSATYRSTSSTPKQDLTATPFTVVGGEVRVFPSSNPQSEIHLSINKTSPYMLLLSSNTLVANSDQGAWWSLNSGSSWSGAETMPNNSSGRNDPSTAFDATGRGYLGMLTPQAGNLNAEPVGYSIQTTTSFGSSWSNPISGTGNNPVAIDKPMIGVDDLSTSPFVNNFYCAWMGPNNVVQFNRSTNQGAAFSAPINLTNYWGQGTNVKTGPNGEVYICWADYNGNNVANNWTSNGLDFVSSVDGGQTFTAVQRVLAYVGIRQFNALKGDDENPNFNGIRVNDFPAMAVDRSPGNHRGRIYVCMPVRQNGNGKAIIQVSSSDNHGLNWSAPVTVSIANATQSFFPWIAADAATGLVYVVYYAFDQASGFSTNTYVATSLDGGANWTNQKVSSVAHTTAPISNYINGYEGDYIGIDAYQAKAYPAWMDNRTGQWQDYVLQMNNSPIVNGIPAFCSSTTYTVSNLLPNTTVTWSVSPAGVINIAPNGNSVTATRVSQGYVTLTATVNELPNLAGSINLTTVPQISNINYFMSGGCSNGIQSWSVTATANMPTSTGWHWTVDNPNSGIFINNPSSPSTFMDVTKGGGVSVTYVDGCGETSLKNGITIYNPCGPRMAFTVTPNPANSMITISAVTSPTGASAETASSGPAQINIYDFQNVLQRHLTVAQVAGTSINIGGLPKGFYVVEIVLGSLKEKHEIQILR